jgi:hypothetical protein
VSVGKNRIKKMSEFAIRENQRRKEDRKRLKKYDFYIKDYKIRMIVFSLFLVMWSCLLIFWVRIFEKWDKAQIINAEYTSKGSVRGLHKLTYLVNGKEYTAFASKQSNTSIAFRNGEWIDYQVSNPNYIMWNRKFPLIILSVVEGLQVVIMVALTIQELKRQAKKYG